MKTSRLLAVAVGVWALAGCSDNAPKMHPVSGKVVLAGSDPQKLVGHHVEAVLEGDPAVRASGLIGPGGTFTLETLYAGKVFRGAQEGKYQVRILAADEDDEGKKLRKPPVAKKHFTFEGSGLSLQVPPPGDVTLELSSR